MNRLQSQLERLYVVDTRAGDVAGTPSLHAKVRGMVMEVTRPTSWRVLSNVWQGVQQEFALPAPAIAVSGDDALQLWFSLADAVSVADAHAFLGFLQTHFLPDVDPARVRLYPSPTDLGRARPTVPSERADTGNWSAFVAPDLAPVFDDAPWLDTEPNQDGQANLLTGLRPMTPAELDGVLDRLEGTVASPADVTTGIRSPPSSLDPETFLRQVMNDATVPLTLRIEAARALLPRRP